MIKRILMKVPVSLLIIKHFDVAMVKRIIPVTGVVLMLFLFSTAALAARAAGTADYEDEDTGIVQPREPRVISPGIGFEEDSDTIFTSDEVITGDAAGYSEAEGRIKVDGAEYRICDSVKVFSAKGKTISGQDIGAAERVTIFIDGYKNCIRKIKILESAR